MEGLKRYGEKGIKEIAEFIKTRNPAQVRSHLQKYKLKNPTLREPGEVPANTKSKKKSEENKEQDTNKKT